ncbi:MAG: hypothetical protein ABJE47_04085 [bacterium]
MTPDNAGYYHVAYMAAAIVYIGYALSIRVRASTLRKRFDALTTRTSEHS